MRRAILGLATMMAVMMLCLFSTTVSAMTPDSTLTTLSAAPTMHPTFTAGGTASIAFDVSQTPENVGLVPLTSLTAMKDDVKASRSYLKTNDGFGNTAGAHALLDDGHRFYLYQR